MSVFLLFIGLLIVLSIFVGVYNVLEVDINIGVKQWDSLYFQIGVNFVEHTLEDGNIEQELSINLFFITINVIFYKFGA